MKINVLQHELSCWFSFYTCYVYLLFAIWVLLHPMAHGFHYELLGALLAIAAFQTTYFLYFWMNISQ